MYCPFCLSALSANHLDAVWGYCVCGADNFVNEDQYNCIFSWQEDGNYFFLDVRIGSIICKLRLNHMTAIMTRQSKGIVDKCWIKDYNDSVPVEYRPTNETIFPSWAKDPETFLSHVQELAKRSAKLSVFK